LDEVRGVLGEDKSKWPTVRRVTSEAVLKCYRWFKKQCPLCRRVDKLEPHHLTGGSKGCSDEHANLIAICRSCHEKVQSQPSEYRRVWAAKWRTDRGHTDWVRLVTLLGRFPEFVSLDDPEPG
jgi:5-methylcytosine-specific restriction endonuclease McrA